MAKPFRRELCPNTNYVTKNVEHFLRSAILVANIPQVSKILTMHVVIISANIQIDSQLLFYLFIFSFLIAYKFNNTVLLLYFHGMYSPRGLHLE
jgi:hypothetical protein